MQTYLMRKSKKHLFHYFLHFSYLIDIINDHKIPKNLKVQSNNEVIDYET